MPKSLYEYIWNVNRRGQVTLLILTALVFPLAMVPLELQRRIINEAVQGRDLELLMLLGGGYLALLLIQGGLKYLMNMQRGRVVQHAKSHLREAVYYCIYAVVPPQKWRGGKDGGKGVDQGTVVSMISAEVEKLGQFIGDSLSVPLLQGGTMVVVLGYMIYVEPVVALIGLAVYLPQMIIIPLMQRRINAYNRTYSERLRELGDFIVENAENAEQSQTVPQAYSDVVQRMFADKMKALRLKFIMKFLRNLINGLGPLSILLIGGWFVIQGKTEIGTMVAFLSGFEKISGPWTELIAFYREVSNSRMKYAMLVDEFPQIPDDAGPPPQPSLPSA